MSIFKQTAKVKLAQARMREAREALVTPASALLARGHDHPLTTVAAAAGAGFVLGTLNVHPLRVPGLGPLLSGGLAETVGYATRLIADLGVAGLGTAASGAAARHSDDMGAGSGDVL